MTPVQPAQLSRRMIIGLSLAAPTLAVPWLAGCSSDDPAAGNPVRAAETPAAPTVKSCSHFDAESEPDSGRVESAARGRSCRAGTGGVSRERFLADHTVSSSPRTAVRC